MFLATTRSHQLVRDGADVLARCAAFKEVWEIRDGKLVPMREIVHYEPQGMT